MVNKANIAQKIGIASFIMMGSVLASRFIGVFREMVIAGLGGIKAGVDAYQLAFIIPEILNHIVASGFLSITFIPIFSYYLAAGRKQEGERVFSNIMNCFGLLLIIFIIISLIWTEQLVSLFAPGIQSPQTFSLAVKMTRIIIPAQFFFFAGGLLMAVQFANEKFFIPALAPLIYNLFIILGGLMLAPYMGMEGFAWGVLAGAFMGNFALQIIGLKKLHIRYFPIFNISHPDLIKYIKLTLPLMLGLTMIFSTEILVKFFGSFLETGRIAAMNYAIRIMFILVGLFGQAIGMASYPFMAKLAGEGKFRELNELLNNTLKFIFLVIPFSVLFIVLNHEIVLLLFQRGRFDAQATMVTAEILPFFMVGAFAFSAQTLVSRGYYAVQNTLFPSIFSSVCVLLSLPFIYALMILKGATGLALGLSISVVLQVFVLFECWSRKNSNTDKKHVYLFFLKIILISLLMGVLLYFSVSLLRGIISYQTFKGALIISLATGIEFILLLLAMGKIFKIHELTILFEKIIKRRKS